MKFITDDNNIKQVLNINISSTWTREPDSNGLGFESESITVLALINIS